MKIWPTENALLQMKIFQLILKTISLAFASVLETCFKEGRWYSPLRCEKCLCAFSEDIQVDNEFLLLKMKTSKL